MRPISTDSAGLLLSFEFVNSPFDKMRPFNKERGEKKIQSFSLPRIYNLQFIPFKSIVIFRNWETDLNMEIVCAGLMYVYLWETTCTPPPIFYKKKDVVML